MAGLSGAPNKGEVYSDWVKRTGYSGPQSGTSYKAVWSGTGWDDPKSLKPPTTTKPPVVPKPEAPTAPGTPAPAAPTTGGGPIVTAKPTAPSMQGLLNGGGGDMGGSGVEQLSGPSRFRQGIGSRILPQMSQSLAALRQVY